MQKKKFDYIIIGGGPGGYSLALELVKNRKNVLVVEKDNLGGVCTNQGCIPTKALIYASKNIYSLRNKNKWLENLEYKFNFKKLLQWKDRVVITVRKGIEFLFKRNGVNFIKGTAEIDENLKLKIDGDIFEYDNLIIATGSLPSTLPLDGFEKAYTPDDFLKTNFNELPKKVCIIGAGVIGFEIGFMVRYLGSEVCIIEILKEKQILPNIDRDILDVLLNRAKKDGLKIYFDSKAKIYKEDKIIFDHNGEEKCVECEIVIVAVGRKPNLQGIKIFNKEKFLRINDRFETEIPKIYAIGDITGGPFLAHRAYKHAYFLSKILKGEIEEIDFNKIVIPSVIYTPLEIVQIGIGEDKAREMGIKYKVSKIPFASIGRALTIGEREGFIKIITNLQNEIIGAQLIGPEVSEIINLLTFAIQNKIKIGYLKDLTYPHPSLSEVIYEALLKI